jgi:hypothetical protein
LDAHLEARREANCAQLSREPMGEPDMLRG